MKKLLLSLLLFWPILQIPALGDDDDSKYRIVLGKRVGEIQPGMNLDDIIQIYGNAVQPAPIPGPEGSSFDGAYLFRGTNRELQLIWDPESPARVVAHIRVIGKEWKFSNDLKLGKSIKDVEELNGGPFRVWGFEWDLGGFADFEGGRLAGVVGIRFNPSKPQKLTQAVIGDQQVPSNHPAMRDVKPEVSEITVNFPMSALPNEGPPLPPVGPVPPGQPGDFDNVPPAIPLPPGGPR